jgi:Fic family protein
MDKLTQIARSLSQLPTVQDLNSKQKAVAALRPLSAELEGRIMQKLRLEWNYHSNAIEGNPMSYGETVTYLMYGLTAKGKTLKDHLDIRGHNEAIFLLLNMVKDDRPFSETDIRELHKIILVEPYYSDAITPDGKPTKKLIQLGVYKEQPNHVRTPTGEIHYYATPEDVPILMGELMAWYNAAKNDPQIHPSVLAAIFHHRFVAIHPFDDGNGRLGRILMNLILMQKGYPPAIVKLKDRDDYYISLNNANAGNYNLLVEYITDALKNSLDIYLRAAKGERVEEMGDIDKELALFVRSFDKKEELIERSNEIVDTILQSSIFPFWDLLIRKLETLTPLFSKKSIYVRLDSNGYDVDNNGNNFLSVFKKHLEKEPESTIRSTQFSYRLEGFKAGNDPFRFDVECLIEFNQWDYKAIYPNNHDVLNMTKRYNQLIDQNERLEIVEKILKATMKSIQQRHSPPSV